MELEPVTIVLPDSVREEDITEADDRSPLIYIDRSI